MFLRVIFLDYPEQRVLIGAFMKIGFWWRVALRRDRGPDKAGPSSIFTRGGEPAKVIGHFYENRRLEGGRRAARPLSLRRGDPRVKLIAARRSAPTLPQDQHFHPR